MCFMFYDGEFVNTIIFLDFACPCQYTRTYEHMLAACIVCAYSSFTHVDILMDTSR